MELKSIISISGKPGLYNILSTTRNSFIVESLDGIGKRFPVAATQKIASLNDISIYTVNEQEMLSTIFKTMATKEAELPAPDPKADDYKIMEYFEQILPEYDEDRVYVNDMRKVIKWFSALKNHIDFANITIETDADLSKE
jgi:hypothetical protein